MKILDRYLISIYLKTFFFTALLFSLVSIVIDLSDRLDKFIQNEVPVREVVLHYYIPFVISMNGLLWPLFALVSVIFFTSRLARNSEIISILNAGVSFYRIIVPYFLASSLIFIVHMVANHYLIPMGNKIKIPFENSKIHSNADESRSRDIHIMLDPKTKLYIRNYRQRDTTAIDLRIEKYDSLGILTEFLEAKRGKWIGPPDRWQVSDYMIRTFDGLNESIKIFTDKQLDTTIQITPEDLTRIRKQEQIFTSSELAEYLQTQRSRGIGGTRIFETELQRRTSEPVSIFILSIIGLAVASRKTRGGLGLHLAVGISLGAIFLVLSRFTMTFTNAESLGPFIGVWLPNILFSFVALFLIYRAQK